MVEQVNQLQDVTYEPSPELKELHVLLRRTAYGRSRKAKRARLRLASKRFRGRVFEVGTIFAVATGTVERIVCTVALDDAVIPGDTSPAAPAAGED